MTTVSMQPKKAPSEQEKEMEETRRAYTVVQSQTISLVHGWAPTLTVALLGSSQESMNRLMPEAVKLGGTEVRITEVGSKEWFGSEAMRFLENGQKNLGALAVTMGNLREEDLPRQLYRTAMGMLTNGMEIDAESAKTIGNQLTKYAILAGNKELDVTAAWGNGLARQKDIVQKALAQVEKLANAERYDEARMLQNSVAMYIDSVEKLGIREGGAIKSVNGSFDAGGMEKALTIYASGRRADSEASASFLRSYISCQSAYMEEASRGMPAGRDAVLRELGRARTERDLTDAMGGLDRASFALQMSSSYAQLQQQYAEISAYEKTQKPVPAENLSQMLKKCETALSTMNLDAYKTAMGDFVQRYGELVTKKHMEENRKDAFLGLVSAQLMVAERYWRFTWADGGNDGKAMKELKHSMDYLSKAQEAMMNGKEEEARKAYVNAIDCRINALEMLYRGEKGYAGLAKPPSLSMESGGKAGYEQYLKFQMDVLDGILSGRWPRKDDQRVLGAELIEQSVFYIPRTTVGNYGTGQRSVRERAYDGDIATAQKTAHDMLNRATREKTWMSVGQTAGGIALGFTDPVLGGYLAFAWFANMARENLVSEYRMTGSVSPGSIAMSAIMVAPLGLGISGGILRTMGRTGAAAWTTSMIVPVTAAMVGAGVWGGAENIAEAAKTDDQYYRNTLLLQAALNLSMAGLGVVGGVQVIRGGAIAPVMEQLRTIRYQQIRQSLLNAADLLTGQGMELAYATAGARVVPIKIARLPRVEKGESTIAKAEAVATSSGASKVEEAISYEKEEEIQWESNAAHKVKFPEQAVRNPLDAPAATFGLVSEGTRELLKSLGIEDEVAVSRLAYLLDETLIRELGENSGKGKAKERLELIAASDARPEVLKWVFKVRPRFLYMDIDAFVEKLEYMERMPKRLEIIDDWVRSRKKSNPKAYIPDYADYKKTFRLLVDVPERDIATILNIWEERELTKVVKFNFKIVPMRKDDFFRVLYACGVARIEKTGANEWKGTWPEGRTFTFSIEHNEVLRTDQVRAAITEAGIERQRFFAVCVNLGLR